MVMVFLDVIQLFLVPDFNKRSQDSIAGRICHATLQYIVHLEGLAEFRVSEKIQDGQLWLFLFWNTSENHEKFLDESLGVGLLIPFLRKPPRVYSFADMPPALLEGSSDILIELYEFESALSDEDLKLFKEQWRHARLHTSVCAVNDAQELPSFLGLLSTAGISASADQKLDVGTLKYDLRRKMLNLDHVIADAESQTLESNPPATTPELLCIDTRLYGKRSFDESEVGNKAYPNGLSFRPMNSIDQSSWFPYDEPDEIDESSPEAQKFMAIVTIYFAKDFDEADPNITTIAKEFSIQPGLERLYWCRDDTDMRIVRFIAAWEEEKNFRDFESLVLGGKSALKDRAYIEHDPKFTPFPTGWNPDWDDGSIVEALTFGFPHVLTKYERAGFLWYLHRFLGKMMPESSELGEVTVVNPEGPYWFPVDPQDGCLVFLRWNGLAHRKAWFQNFMAHHYSITGHLVHVLALASPNINSTTVVMHSVDNYKYFFEAKR